MKTITTFSAILLVLLANNTYALIINVTVDPTQSPDATSNPFVDANFSQQRILVTNDDGVLSPGETVNVNIDFTGNQHLEVFATESVFAGDFELVALNFVGKNTGGTSPGSISGGTVNFDMLMGDFLETPPLGLETIFSLGGTSLWSTDVFRVVTPIPLDLTDTSFLFHGLDYSFTLSSSFTAFEYDLIFTSALGGDFGVGAWVSEPGSIALFGLGLAGIGFARRRKS